MNSYQSTEKVCTTIPPKVLFGKLEGARASTGLCVDVSSGLMIQMKVIIICSRSQFKSPLPVVDVWVVMYIKDNTLASISLIVSKATLRRARAHNTIPALAQ